MRHIAFYLGMAAMLVASCSIQEESFKAPDRDAVRFWASFEQLADAGTKAYVNEYLQIRWTADDRVGIFNQSTFNQQYRFLVNSRR